jgi:hypothetical protein
MFPTMELLLRHAVNYLDMKKSPAVASSGVLDNEEDMLKDFDKLTLAESRAVLCTHMLCYVLDGSIGSNETSLWGKMLGRVEEIYQAELEKFATLSKEELRAYIVTAEPTLKEAVERVPPNTAEEVDMANAERASMAKDREMRELQNLVRARFFYNVWSNRCMASF